MRMVSFKTNNVTSEQPTSHCQVPGALRVSLNHFHNYQANHSHRHEALSVGYRAPPPLRPPLSPPLPPPPPPPPSSSSSSSDPTVQRGCALHPRLDQPVTTSTPGMDNKKIVQATTAVVAVGQVRNKNNDAQGVAASVSGIRRRSGPQGLRSPAAKRPLSAPVALQGWLLKQGSEGLMLWKKRWFVLSEYCLFYYKGPEEEKLLGSILLPSYRVTVCRPEDKVNRKFAFKAEHANMRTYHFAAESRESMNQWVNALTLATLLQDPSPGRGEAAVVIEIGGQPDGERSARPSVSSISSILNQSADDSDSGFHGFQSRDEPSHASNNNSSPNSVNTASFPNLSASNGNGNAASNANNNNNLKEVQPVVNGWVQHSPQYGQPGSSQHPNSQYGQLHPASQQLQQGHSHQHQALLHQHQAHQNIPQIYHHKHTVSQQSSQQPQVHTALSNVQTVQPMPRKFGQPIYANAPPKPRRLTDGSNEYSTPSPEPDYRKSPVSPDVTLTSKSPISDYDRNSVIYGTRMSQPSQQSLRTDKSGLNYGYCQAQATERRTPDTYGRSAKPRLNRGNGDYEEVYGIPQLYQRPAGPIVGYTKGSAPAPIPIPTYAQHQQMHQQQLHSPITPPSVPIIRQPVAHQPPPRPHSADFLEYEATRRPQQQTPVQNEGSLSQQKRPQRPKSSLDIMNPSDATNDGYYYSEERYAAQMRQSAVYLHQTPQHHQQQRNQSLSRATVPSKTSTVHDKSDDLRMATLPDSSCSTLRRMQREHQQRERVHQQHAVPPQSLQRHNELSNNDAKLRRSLREKVYETNARNTLTREYESSMNWNRPSQHSNHGVNIAQTCQPSHAGAKRWNEQQQFCRSASARLPRSRHPATLDQDEDDYGERSSEQDSRDGERKIQQREESMKRLLEWKQRMLQSPLTRKPSGSANRGRVQNELSNYYKQQALLDLAAHEASVTEARHARRREDSHRPHVRSKSSDGRRTVTSVSRYNSYSSDDEEMGDVRRKRTRRPSHAGRSPRHAGDDRTSMTPTQDNGKLIQGSIRMNVSSASSNQSAQTSSRSSNDPKIAFNTMSILPLSSSIPPDAGYEEISFPPASRETYPNLYCVSSEEKSGKKIEQIDDRFYNEAQHKHQTALPKKPAGILKSPTVYEVEEQPIRASNENPETSTMNDYVPAETWHVQKNVQWNSNEDKEEWDSNIDESKFIKEFSYQYIKPKQAEQAENMEDHLNRLETMNLVQSRIRSFESNTESGSPVKEMLTMQEALKASPVETAEAHVSRLDPTKKASLNIRSFALGENGVQENVVTVKNDGHVKQASTDSNKSVKDLLADFERKSQQVRLEERDRQSEVMHRGVFSDTETLLYDTGSDLDQRDKSGECEEEQREELDQNQITSDSSKDIETYLGTLKKKKDSPMRQKRSKSPDNIEQRIPMENLIIDPTSTCKRLSFTESLFTHGDQFSVNSDVVNTLLKQEDITPEEHYLPMSPRKAILDPNDDDRPNSKMMESLFANLDHEESSYVEMAQNSVSHSLLAPSMERNARDSGDYSTLDASHYEFVCVSDSKMEPVYMEVSQLSEKEEKEDDKICSRKQNINEDTGHTRSDLPDILTALKSDSSDADDESSKDLDSIDAPRHPRFSLSDTFRPASYYLGASRTMIAELHDSSDSELVSPPPIPTSPPPLEDLDCLEMQDSLEVKKVSPQVAVMKENVSSADSPKSWNRSGHGESQRSPSRFSEATISSTFRDSRISLESASGSDSVELRNPEEEARHRRMKRRPVSDEVCEVLDSLDELESLGSRFDGTSIDLDQYLAELQARDAFNVDLYAKDLSYNSIYGFNENMMVVDKLQKTTCPDLSRKMNILNFGQPLRYDTMNKIGSASSLPSMRVCDLPPSHQHSQSFTGDAHYENVSSFSPLRNSPAIRSDGEQFRDENRRPQRSLHDTSAESHHSRDSSYSMGGPRPLSGQSSTHSPMGSISSGHHGNNLASNLVQTNLYGEQKTLNHSNNGSVHQEPMRYPLLPKHRSPSNSDHIQRPSSTTSVKTNSHSQSYLSNTSEQRIHSDQPGAPYYYSDLRASAQNSDNDKPIGGHVSRLPQLNNQRDDASAMNKRNDIGRIVNPIARQMPRQIQVEGIDEARRIAAELRKTTCQLLGDTKVDLVDKRNFYEADTLRRVKSTDPLPDTSLPEVSTRNLYPHGLRDKSNGQLNENMTMADISLAAQASHRRSRSLEGLLDDVGLQNLVEQRNRANRLLVLSSAETAERARNVPSSDHCPPSTTNDFNVEDPWEQDSLWRENLRRASLRNARSLENLDNPTRSTGSSSCPDNKTRARITRGATYVNDSVAIRRDNDSSSSERPPRVKRRVNKEDPILDDLSYLSENRRVSNPSDVAAYTWDSRNEVYRKESPDERNHFLAEGNLPSTRAIPEGPSTCVGSRAANSGTTSASFELDREKLRQWDLLSSACLLQEQQQSSTADSGRGLPNAADRILGDVMDSKCVPANTIGNATTMMTNATMTMTMTTTMTTTTITTTTTTTATTTMTAMTTTLTSSTTPVTEVLKMTGMIDNTNDATLFVKHHSSSSLETTKRREAIETKDSCNRATASGSGSVIGRDPLPPRAVSTSHLAERTLTQPPAVETPLSSTLPLPRTSGGHRQQQHLPIRRSSPQQQQQLQLESQILRTSSNGDIGTNVAQTNNNEMKDLKVSSPSGHQTQRLHASTGHLRVMGLNDHRMSSPSDNEIQVHSPIERKVISPIGILDSHRSASGGGVVGGNIRGNQRIRESTDLLHIKSNANLGQRRGIASGSPTAAAAATATSTPTTTPAPTPTLTPTLTPTQGGPNDLVRVSAGELLGRTHEELVLLLIQLRRQNATLLKAMDNCHMEIEAQARLAEFDIPRRLENLQRLEELKNHLMDLEKQYEKGKPLVNLVDNMVKLGSLYNRNANNGSSSVTTSRHDLFQENAKNHRDRLEFNQRVQEQRLLAEERRDWDRLSPDHGQLQAKVQQLYKLDRLLQEESGTLHSLQQDKEILEKALGGLRHKLQGSRSNLVEAERYRKQQLLLERELSRVRVLLAHNSKVKPVLNQKLEETVAENARLEQDLVVLRQKLQASRRYAGNMTRDTSGTTAPLETELRRVQQLVGDLQRQRKELSVQVQQLTEKSHSLVQQIRPQASPAPPVHQSKKRNQNSWLETDLDSGVTLDHGLDSPVSPSLLSSPRSKQNESSYHRYTSPTQHKKSPSPSRQQHVEQPFVQSPQNHISALSPQLREQIQQHQLKQQLLKDQMQGKGSLMQMNVAPLYVNTESRMQDTNKSHESGLNQINGGPNAAPEYIPPPPPPPLNEETSLTNDNYRQSEDNKFAGLLHNREKQEIKTVRIVKRESERRQRDRGDRTGNIGIPLTNGLQAPGGAKRLSDDDIASSQKCEKTQLGRVVEEAPIAHAQSTVHLTDLDDVQFQRSMSLPRGFGGQRHHPNVHHAPVAPPPRSDSMHALRSIMMRRHKVKFENHDGSSDSTLSPYIDSPTSSSQMPMSSPNYSTSPPYSPSHQSYHHPGQSTRGYNQQTQQPRYYSPHPQYGQYESATTFVKNSVPLSPEPVSPNNLGVPQDRSFGSIANVNNPSDSPQLSPVFKSEAAKQIIKEVTEKKVDGPRRRQVPKEKRRHYTVSSSKPILDLEDSFSRMGMGRARDDLDMERALRPRINAPDVVRSTLSHKELKYNESTIDQLLGTPNKIVIPERYIPEQTPELTAEEQEHRLKKAEAIRKMLSETTVTAADGNDDDVVHDKSDMLKRKVVEEKRQRNHILQLNQILAKQVMEKSKMVAVKALATLPLKTESSIDDEDLSPVTPLPLYQQRENYYS